MKSILKTAFQKSRKFVYTSYTGERIAAKGLIAFLFPIHHCKSGRFKMLK